MKIIQQSLALLAFVFLSSVPWRVLAGRERQHLQIKNDSTEKVDVHWIDPDGKEIPLGSPTSGETLYLNSFVNHTLVIKTSKKSTNVTVSGDPEQVIVVRDETDSATKTSKRESQEWVSGRIEICKERAKLALQNGDPADVLTKGLSDCIVAQIAELFEEKNAELAAEDSLRTQIAFEAENYTCADPDKETSDPVHEFLWSHEGIQRRVEILHDRPSSQIHVLHDFISTEECLAIQNAADKHLHRGTVADGKGGHRLSESRKAWQAGIKVNHETDNPISKVQKRLFAYANEMTGLNMTLQGQEDIMSIQYFGKGEDDPTPDRYTPHCDGDCNGRPHKKGGRVATMVMYCDVPEKGGGTNFQRSNVFVKPTKGAAAFFSYINPETLESELGYTMHSGCPVLRGTKRIAVQWLRLAVSADEPWDSFDTNFISKKDQI